VRLSEAIRLGSLLVERPMRGETRACAIGMGLLANGVKPVGAFAQPKNDYHLLLEKYPWLIGAKSDCPICSETLIGCELLWHPFDLHVTGVVGRMTIEQLADFIASIEPSAEPTQAPSEAALVEDFGDVCESQK
jgi:hypothetical protein